MDPDHATCYAQAQVELRELFHELECNGQVSAAELQRSLAPFTAGDVKRDLLELLAELKRKRQSLDESEFLRVMWRKMYLSSAVDATKGAAAGQNKPINVSLAHVIVSVKRRRQLKQFATYYASRGISGADHLTTPSKAPAAAGKAFNSPPKGSPQIRKDALSPLSRGQQQTDLHSRELPAPPETDSSVESVVALRRRHSPCYDVVACVYDSKRRELRTQMVLTRARSADVRNCSHLYCLLFTREAGNFVLGCTHFGDSAKLDRQKEIEERGIVLESDNDLLAGSALCRTVSWADRDEDGLLMIRMEELGLRNIAAGAANRAAFAASTGRKLHQWRAPEPYRILENGNAIEVGISHQSGDSKDEKDNNSADPQDAAPAVEMLDVDPSGDCFGLLGGKPLIARTKTIADVAELRQLAAGDHFFMAVSTSGGLYSWESNPISNSSTAPPLGRGYASPERVPWFSSPEKVLRVACGVHHALVLSSSGVYAWGSNIYGQLGLGAHCSVINPHVMEPAPVCLPTDGALAQYIDVACGDFHSVVLSADGEVFTFGCNWEGQLGIDESHINERVSAVAATGCAYEPLPVSLQMSLSNESARVYLITAGPQTTAAVVTTGQVFQWGKCVPAGIDGVCGRVSRWTPEGLNVRVEDSDECPGPVWHSIAIADGLTILTRHFVPANPSPDMSTPQSRC